MRRSFAITVLALIMATWPSTGRAMPSAPFSTVPAARGNAWVSVNVGFPMLEGRLQYGVASFMDIGFFANSAWGHVQRAGLASRVALHQGSSAALGLGLALDGWLARPATDAWLALTGRQDFSAVAELVGSTATAGGTLLTIAIGPVLIGTRSPPAQPLGGATASFALGWNVRVRAAVEWPLESGWTVSIPVGLDFHRNGFDGLSTVPFAGLGLGWQT